MHLHKQEKLDNVLIPNPFTLEETIQIDKKMANIPTFMLSFQEAWQFEAIISRDWDFFEKHLEMVDSEGYEIIYYISLNGNVEFLNKAKVAFGEDRFKACLEKSEMHSPIIDWAFFSLNLPMIKWFYDYSPALFTQGEEHEWGIDYDSRGFSRLAAMLSHRTEEKDFFYTTVDWLTTLDPDLFQTCSHGDGMSYLEILLFHLKPEEILEFCGKRSNLFQDFNWFGQILLMGMTKQHLPLCDWVRENVSLFREKIPPQFADTMLYTAWREGYIAGIDFCYQYLSDIFIDIDSKVIESAVKSSLKPQTIAYFHLIDKAGWESAYAQKQKDWPGYLRQLAPEQMSSITALMWEHGNTDDIHFCYSHFAPFLRELDPREIAISRFFITQHNYESKPVALEFVILAFLRSSNYDSFAPKNILDFQTIIELSARYLLLLTVPISENCYNHDQEAENRLKLNLTRNDAINANYPTFKELVKKYLFMKNIAIIPPDIPSVLAPKMFEVSGINRNLLGFFKPYEEQKQQLKDCQKEQEGRSLN